MVGLLLLSLLDSTGTAGPANAAAVFAQVWTSEQGDGQLSSLPPQGANVREHHELSLWPPARPADTAHVTLLPAPEAAEAIADPQQLVHRTAGSRSPPSA
ncbi:MAG: hypothetical protein HOY71_00665 [Nonomuraea sp.]|nr:hypothetical protein [Nonomuraea sp.]